MPMRRDWDWGIDGRIAHGCPEPVTLELRHLNILIWPNGSGKSNLIEAISRNARSLSSSICPPAPSHTAAAMAEQIPTASSE